MSADLPYDPEARRDTPLALDLKRQIRKNGPIPLALFVRNALELPKFGYYRTAEVIGRSGDFVTAPEISQTFGELIGLWCAVVWQQMGSPPAFDLIELGPGRGTLLDDALRASRSVPGFHAAMTLILHDINPDLRRQQSERISAFAVPTTWTTKWPGTLDAKYSGRPAIVIANEYMDALAPNFLLWRDDKVLSVSVELDERERLVYGAMTDPPLADYADFKEPPPRYPDDVIFEDWNTRAAVLTTLEREMFAACFIDYGHTETRSGFSLQAVRQHRFEHPLTSPGEADLSTQVDFATVTHWMQDTHLLIDGPITQAEFLGSLGIMQRASRLMAANPAKANEIETGVARLMAPNGMGTRFKVLGVRSKGLPPLPGFPTNPTR